MPRALLSVSDKTGIVQFAKGLTRLGFEILSTAGTAQILKEANIEVCDVGDVTGFREMLDGRVKTLHPAVHAGLLADIRLPEHRKQIEEAQIEPIELLCVNLYPFEASVTQEHTEAQAIEAIDIGGPAMIRAAAKNAANVTVVTDPEDYEAVLLAHRDGGLPHFRLKLQAKAFRHTAYYDSIVSRYLTERAGEPYAGNELTLGYRRTMELRYGENPHQNGCLYLDPLASGGIARARQLWGKELSYNNLLDADAAWELVCDLPPGSCAIVKHGNPCGAAHGDTMAESYRLALETDPTSAFGGIAAVNAPLTIDVAEAMCAKGQFLEVVIAPSFDRDAVRAFQNKPGWGENVRLLVAKLSLPDPRAFEVHSIGGGVLVQDVDEEPTLPWRTVTKAQATEAQLRALQFAWEVVKHVKSNAIVVSGERRVFGVGAGQMNRVQSVKLALEEAGQNASGAGLASDAYFPFPDSVELAADAGIAAIVQPGGSKKDSEAIAAADARGIVMMLTGHRHFKH